MDIVMVVAQREFRDEELIDPSRALEAAGHTVVVASQVAGLCTGVHGSTVLATLGLEEIRPGRFDGVVFVGGPGARSLFDDPAAHRLAVEAVQGNKLLGAICLAPVILARAGVLTERRATVFSSEVEELVRHQAKPQRQGVVVDGKLVTAAGPSYAKEFGASLVEVLGLEQRGQPRPARPNSPERHH